MSLPCVNVVATCGAVGDGIHDDTPNFQSAFNAVAPGGAVCIPQPPNFYKIAGTISAPNPCQAIGQQSKIQQTKVGVSLFAVYASNVSLNGLHLIGQGHAGQVVGDNAISAIGLSAASPIVGFEVNDCIVENFGFYAIYMKYVEMFRLLRNDISDIWYAGIGGASVQYGAINKNTVSNIVGTPNAYGVILSRNSTAANELVSDPLSADISVDDNLISGVLHWEGLDTHAGQRISFTNNRVLGCYRGIAVGDCPNKAGISTYAPQDCIVADNTIDSQRTDGTALYGINLNGAGAVIGAPTQTADGCVITENTIRGHGFQGLNNEPAIYLYNTRGLSIKGGTIIEPGGVGIGFFWNNYGFTCSGVTIQDPWSNVTQGQCVKFVNDWNRGVLGNNSYVRGGKQATSVLQWGTYISNFPNVSVGINKGYSDIAGANNLFDPGNRSY